MSTGSPGKLIRLQGFLVILGAIVVGAAGGIFIERARTPDPPTRSWRGGERSMGPGRRGGDQFPRGFDQLNLTDEQRDQIDSVFRAWEPRTKAIMEEFLPKIRALRDSVRTDVDSVLTPEQREQAREFFPPHPRDGRGGRPRNRKGPDNPGRG